MVLTAVSPDVLLTDHEHEPHPMLSACLTFICMLLCTGSLLPMGSIAYPGTRTEDGSCLKYLHYLHMCRQEGYIQMGVNLESVSLHKAHSPFPRRTTMWKAQGLLEQLYGVENNVRGKEPVTGTATDTRESDSIRPARQSTRRDGKVIHLAKSTVRSTCKTP